MAENTVTKRDLAKVVAKTHGMTQIEATEIIQTVLERITEELAEGNRLELRNFGVFEPRLRQARPARNPRTGESLYAEARAKVAFKVGKQMSEKVQKALPGLGG